MVSLFRCFRLAPEPRDALEVRRVASDPSVEFRRGREEPREAVDVARDTAPEPMPKDALDTRRDSCDIGVAAFFAQKKTMENNKWGENT